MGGCLLKTELVEDADIETLPKRSVFKKSATARKLVVGADSAKILLLGAGECGKATIYKQLRLKYAEETFTEEFRKTYRYIIQENAISAIRKLCRQSDESKDPECSVSDENLESKAVILEFKPTSFFNSEVAWHIDRLWKDPGIQKCYSSRSKFHYIESTAYLMERIHEIAALGYVPSVEDVLHARLRTTGISEFRFKVQDTVIQLCLTGGQRNERKKWILCFEKVKCVVFVAAISEYDQMLYEDDTVNRLHESLILFEEIVNSKHFVNSEIVLLLNKSDLFEEKLKKVPLSVCFPEYSGGDSIDSARSFLVEQFESKRKDKSKTIHSFFTSAVDTQKLDSIFDSIMQKLLFKS